MPLVALAIRPQDQAPRNNSWWEYRSTGSVIVFVHGVLSSSESCWLNTSTKAFWPDLVRQDPSLGDSALYLAGYYTAFDSTDYSIADCARELLSALLAAGDHPPVLDHERIVFVCHSLGGIVTRYMLERWREKFRQKKVGLLLIASPSAGSRYANYLGNLLQVLRHQTGKQLRWKSDDLVDLDRRFKDALEQRYIPNLIGREACEHRFVFYRRYLGPFNDIFSSVVELESAGRYFGDPRRLPKTDHFSCVKPDSPQHCSHLLLREFYSEVQKQLPVRKWKAPESYQRSLDPRGVTVSEQNVLRCKRLSWDLKITEDGDALGESLFEVVSELRSGTERCYRLPICWVQSGKTGEDVIDTARSSPHISIVTEGMPQQRQLRQTVFFGEATPYPARFVLVGADYNVFSMNVEEFRYKTNATDDNTDFIQKSIRWEHIDELVIKLQFPESMRLQESPFLEVYQLFSTDEEDMDIEIFDQNLSTELQPSLHYSGLLRTATLTVKQPGLWTAYRIVWRLNGKTVDRLLSNAELADLSQKRRLLTALRDGFTEVDAKGAVRERTDAALKALAEYGAYVLREVELLAKKVDPTGAFDLEASDLDLSLMAFADKKGTGKPPALRFVAGTSIHPKYWDVDFPIGDGIAGRAAKKVQPRLFDRRGDIFYQGAYIEVAGCPKHEWLLSIPLYREFGEQRHPLGVVNIGTFSDQAADHLRSLDTPESIGKLALYASGTLLPALLNTGNRGSRV